MRVDAEEKEKAATRRTEESFGFMGVPDNERRNY
jgi:hypothetical protein